jgi:hypothetical protein
VTGAANSELTAAEVTLVRGGAADGTVVVLDGMSAAPTVRVTPTGVGEGTLAVQVQAAAVADEALNPNLASNESAAVEIDNTLPTLAGVAIASNNADTAQAKPGDTVTLVFTASEPIVAPTVLIAGQAADSVENTGGNAWSATRTLGGNDPEGVVAFRIEFADLAGNDGTAVETTSDGSSVTFDRTPPNPPVVTPPASPTANLRPEWTWVSGGGGMALYQHQLDGTGDRAWSTETATTSFTPAADLALGEHTLYVRERDAAGNWSAPGGASVTVCWSVTVTLRPGWNLVSFPGVPWASDAAALLRQVAAGQGWHWTSGPYAAATTLTGQTGYWLARIGDEVKVTVRGGALVGDPPVLAQGWNLIGVAWRTAMADVDARVYRPGWTWNAARGRFGTVRNGASLEVGVAYWLYSAAPDVPLPAP